MKLTKGIKKFMICGIALVSLASVGAINNTNYVSAKHVHTTKVSHNRVNYIYHKMLNMDTYSKHVSKSFEHEFMATLPKFNKYQYYNLNGIQDELTKHDKKVFDKAYSHKINFTVNKHDKFNTKHIYRLFVKEAKDNTTPLTSQDKYNFIKILPKLNYQQVSNIYKNESNDKDNVISDFGNKVGKAIVRRYTQLVDAKLNKKLAPIFKKQNLHISKFDRELAHDEFNDVNKAREQHGLKPLKHSIVLQAVANMRAPQALKAENNPKMNEYDDEMNNGHDRDADKLAHGFTNHETSTDDAHKLGFGHAYDGIGENEAPDSIGIYTIDADNVGDSAYIDDDTTPATIAYCDVRDMMIHDKDSHNGHRENILSKDTQYLAVSTDYNPNIPKSATQMSTVEEFY